MEPAAVGSLYLSPKSGQPHGDVVTVVNAIRPAVEEAKGQLGNLLDNAVEFLA